MTPKLVFLIDGQPVAEYPVLIDESGLQNGGKEAFSEFRKAFPKKSLLDDDVTFRLEKA